MPGDDRSRGQEQSWGAQMDVDAWLHGLGLGQYEAAFRQNEIDAEILPDLTDQDLEKLGVPHRT